MLAAFPGAVQRVTAFPANAQQANAVSAASRVIERATPSQPITLAVTDANLHYCRRLGLGLAWALDAGGYQPELVKRPTYERQIPQVTVLLQSTGIDVNLTGTAGRGAEVTSDPPPLPFPAPKSAPQRRRAPRGHSDPAQASYWAKWRQEHRDALRSSPGSDTSARPHERLGRSTWTGGWREHDHAGLPAGQRVVPPGRDGRHVSAAGDAASWVAPVALILARPDGSVAVLAALDTAPMAVGGVLAGWALDRV
jgi:hypothetical protein